MDWLQRQWNDIKGNVKYGLLLLVLAGVGTIAANVTRGLQWWQFSILIVCFLFVFAWAVIATFRSKQFAKSKVAATEDKEVRITIVEAALAEGPSPSPTTLLPYVYLILKVRVLASKNTTLDIWKLALRLEEQFLCGPDITFDDGLFFQELHSPEAPPGQVRAIGERLDQVYSHQTYPQNMEIEGGLVFRASNNTKMDDILGATFHLSASDGNGKKHETTRAPGLWRRRVNLLGLHRIVPVIPANTPSHPPNASDVTRHPHFAFSRLGYKALLISDDPIKGITEAITEDEKSDAAMGITLSFTNLATGGSSKRAMNVVARIRFYSNDWSTSRDIPYGVWLNSPCNATAMEIGAVEELLLLLVKGADYAALRDLRVTGRKPDSSYFDVEEVPWFCYVRVKLIDQSSDTSEVFALRIWNDNGWCNAPAIVPKNIGDSPW